jgi:hypothetical protein
MSTDLCAAVYDSSHFHCLNFKQTLNNSLSLLSLQVADIVKRKRAQFRMVVCRLRDTSTYHL